MNHLYSTWSSIGIQELLDNDSRPSFVLDSQHSSNEVANVLYRNRAFLNEFRPCVSGDVSEIFPEDAFEKWSESQSNDDPSFTSGGYSWTVIRLRDRWTVVSGNTFKHTPEPPIARANGVSHRKATPSRQEHDELILMKRTYKINDWTASSPPPDLSPWCEFLRSWDWAPTPFGPISTWSRELRMMANLVCTCPNPAVLWWGERMAHLYNEPYTRLLNVKHPKAIGRPYRATWPEVYAIPETAKVLDEVWARCANGVATKQENVTYFLLHESRLEEHIFHLNMMPFFGANGETVGIVQIIDEITQEQVRNRRLATLISMADLTAGEEELGAFFARVIEALKSNTYDIPFAILYSIGRSVEGDHVEARRGPNNMYLEGFLGISQGDSSAGTPAVHEKLIEDREFLALFYQAIDTSDLVMFDLKRRPDLQKLLREEPQTRGFGDTIEMAVLCPVEPRASKGVSGVLLMGLNTRRAFDDEYARFFHTLSYSVSTALASILQFEEQKQLAKAASERTLQALTSEQQAKAMLAVAPVGSFLMTLEGKMLYVNDKWMELTGYKLSEHYEKSWMSVIHEDDHARMDVEWSKLAEKHEPVSFELRLKNSWEITDPVTSKVIRGPTYILAAASVQWIGNENYITGALTEISHQKYRERQEIQQREEALELKKQQENFIDMTSHEMRNPLSAIFQCSDLIIAVLNRYRGTSTLAGNVGSELDSNENLDLADPICAAIDAARTVLLCAQQQKRIVDDVLCLSKIDSNLIQITPIDVQPKAMIENALKMFNAELSANKTSMNFAIEKTFDDLKIDWVKLDPGRLLQILINLSTNAIKFTVDSTIRKIDVLLGASSTRPTASSTGVKYLQLPPEVEQADPTQRDDWGQGEPVYLHIQVSDTGRGMSAEEVKLLFQRFSQVARTHTKYGGSGLGLYIARLLTHLQGGDIGVSSTPSKGTTFAFYVKVRRLLPKAIPVPVPVVPDTNIVPAERDQVGSPAPLAHLSLQIRKPTEFSILVVEDNLVNQKVLSRQLQTLGFHVSVANNGQEAIDFLKTTRLWKQNRADQRDLSLILMDIEMPIMTGTEATRRIRDFHADGSIRMHIPIIAITANARLEQIEAVRESGMDDVVSKPFRIPELMEKIGKFLGPIESPS